MTTPAPEPVPPLITALGDLVRAVAAARLPSRQCLVDCQECRNHLLYLLGTVPGEQPGNTTRRAFAIRLREMPHHHQSFHGRPSQALGDTRAPQIRGITS
jgi:hypothetical protein